MRHFRPFEYTELVFFEKNISIYPPMYPPMRETLVPCLYETSYFTAGSLRNHPRMYLPQFLQLNVQNGTGDKF